MPQGQILAIIPARGGSKRIPRKNIRPFGGRPMIHWPVAAALKSGLFDHVVVSTDDDEIAAVAAEAGALRPFVRPASLSDDHTPLRPVIKHAIAAAEEHYDRPVAFACCILATAAFLAVDDLRAGFDALSRPETDFAFAATHFPSPIQRALRRSAAGGVEMLNPEHRFTRSQDLEECFYDVGQFYWGARAPFMDDGLMYGHRSVPIMIPQNRARDIDTLEDWAEAELLLNFHRLSANNEEISSTPNLRMTNL
ncbi:pseudaminic acid cytidylyltransferase [Kumtagia ephedrae]|uniref:pseudaminic acid cytidylyltransferase n=1 Tax=Kumtagia ephedrae TaxID=2116701 RepID=UPI001FDF887D|nr:pseudaminic acid cytidylyltransferase [Mesorhizobium ephedrae]